EDYLRAPVIATPINIMDSSPVCDGAAAVVLVPTERVHEFTRGHHPGAVRILGSGAATDTLAVHDRRDPLWLQAAYISSQKAYQMAHVAPNELDLFEVHDAFTIMSALSLEATGFAKRGEGWRMAQEEAIGINGQLPVSTMGGLKSRGHPVGATGVYQIVEVVQQLTERAGANQVKNAHIGMTQNIGGSGATILTHILAT
ncbi:MAG: thiolase domain-containing protein, partial [Caldilineaceae bacterium]|nr:thiolase domain-containing protein [Caldilineaceae bacterium]